MVISKWSYLLESYRDIAHSQSERIVQLRKLSKGGKTPLRILYAIQVDIGVRERALSKLRKKIMSERKRLQREK